jgi:hypothetical protein
MENEEEPYFESERISELGWSFENKASSPPSKSNCISDNMKIGLGWRMPGNW